MAQDLQGIMNICIIKRVVDYLRKLIPKRLFSNSEPVSVHGDKSWKFLFGFIESTKNAEVQDISNIYSGDPL